VDSGFDVDLAAVEFPAGPWRDTPLHCSHYIIGELDGSGLEQLLLCRKYLLQAGADPTIGSVLAIGSGPSRVTAARSAIETALGRRSGDFRTTVGSCKS
jgi:hypothetical protein